jgi:hypothetical protein
VYSSEVGSEEAGEDDEDADDDDDDDVDDEVGCLMAAGAVVFNPPGTTVFTITAPGTATATLAC